MKLSLETGSLNRSKRPDFALFSSELVKTTKTIKIIDIAFVYNYNQMGFSFAIKSDQNQPFLKFFSFFEQFYYTFFQFIYNSAWGVSQRTENFAARSLIGQDLNLAPRVFYFLPFFVTKRKKCRKLK